jgi:prevent-host-death family protein
MVKRVNAAQAKAHFSALMAAVAYGGERYIIERRGKPLVALVSVDELERLEKEAAGTKRPAGFLAMAGAWRGLMDDAEIDEMVASIYTERERDRGRPVDLGD